MGVWGTDLFSDDLACDIRDHYRELLEDGIEDVAATRLILEKFQAYLEESEGIALLRFCWRLYAEDPKPSAMEKDACVTRFFRRAQIAVELMNLAANN